MKNFKIKQLLVAGAVLSVLTSATVTLAAGPSAVDLGSAGNYVILSKAGISTTGTTLITGNIGVSPAASTFITGFGLTASTNNTFSTTPTVVGNVYAATYASPTPVNLTTAVSNMETAYTDAAGRTNPTATELGAGNIGGLTIAPGLYKWGTGLTIPTDVTLSGGTNDIWIFQIAGTLSVSSSAKIILSGGAQARNVFWVIAGQTTLGTGSDFSGTILGQTAIVLNTGAKLNGRALAQTAVTLDANAVTMPSGVSVASTPATAPVAVQVITPVSQVTVTPVSNNGSMGTTNASVTSSPTQPVTGTVVNPTTNGNMQNVGVTSNSNTNMNANAALGQQVRMINTNFTKGSRGTNVLNLQNFLISQGKGSAAQALKNAGATRYFGVLTKAALAEFQAKVGIIPANGNFGPVTRAYLSAH